MSKSNISRIKLTQGKCALVDHENYEWLNQWKWIASFERGRWYAIRSDSTTGEQQLIRMHRQILGLKSGDGKHTDHINHNGLDNRLCNIRICTNQQNCFNRKNVKGYCWHGKVKRWQARIMLDGKNYSLGYFDTKENAHKAYLHAKQEYHKI